MSRLSLVITIALLSSPLRVQGQVAFHSTQSGNLPTAVVLPRGSLLFEISHRFDTPISNGADDFWGLDGPAVNRLSLGYSVIDRVALTVTRSNFQDNLELNAKVGVWSGIGDSWSFESAVMGGYAWNFQVFEVDGAEDNETQAYVQLILNVGLGDRIAFGVVPTFLRNPRLRDFERENAFPLGLTGQVRLTDAVSVIGEWLVSERREDLEHDPVTVGVELETRGHFFKLILTNQARLNPTQFLGGTPTRFTLDELRFGFNIQRRLSF